METGPNLLEIKKVYLMFWSRGLLTSTTSQGWPTFLASVPNFRFISLGGPKISLKKTWRAKKGIFYNICMRKSPKFKVKILNKSLPGHSKSLGGPKMARGPRVGRPCTRQWLILKSKRSQIERTLKPDATLLQSIKIKIGVLQFSIILDLQHLNNMIFRRPMEACFKIWSKASCHKYITKKFFIEMEI